jgi:hypothetical protein
LNGPDRAVKESAIDRYRVKKAKTTYEKCVHMDAVRRLLGPGVGGMFSLSVWEAIRYSGHRLFDSVDECYMRCESISSDKTYYCDLADGSTSM